MDTESSDPEAKRLRLDESVLTAESCSGNTEACEKQSDEAEEESKGEQEISSADDVDNAGTNLQVEADVGITEYVSKLEGFSGIIKQRFSDFLVNEINLKGEVVHLTELELPYVDSDAASSKEIKQDDVISTEDKEKLKSLQDSRDKSSEVLIKVGSDKQLRGDVHRSIKSLYPALDSQTVDRDGEKYVIVKFSFHKDNRRPDCWKKSEGDYTKFVLYKENMDTLEAINNIAKCLRVKPSCFSYAGTKDRRAKTCQEVTGYRIMPQRLLELNNKIRNRKLVMGNFKQTKEPLKLGDLKGNRFTIVLRNVTGSKTLIEESMTSLHDNGFINYYGMQRFGTTEVPTHRVGSCLLKCNWSEAIDLILQPRASDRPELARARKIWQEKKDADAALKELTHSHGIEKQLLFGLSRYKKNDLVSALNMISRNMRLMYVHGYQSYVWNQVVSRRIAKYGISVCIGDLVIPGSDTAEDLENNDQTVKALEVTVVDSENISKFTPFDVVLPLPGFDIKYPENTCAEFYHEILKIEGMENFNFRHKVRDYSLAGNYRHILVKPVNVSWNMIAYDDYLVPLTESDHDLIIKQNKQTEKQHLSEESNQNCSEECQTTVDLGELQGENQISDEQHRDQSGEGQINDKQHEDQSGEGQINDKQHRNQSGEGQISDKQHREESGGEDKELSQESDNLIRENTGLNTCSSSVTSDVGRYRALVIELNLPSSSYATMAVREVLKCGTSAAFQSTLNVV